MRARNELDVHDKLLIEATRLESGSAYWRIEAQYRGLCVERGIPPLKSDSALRKRLKRLIQLGYLRGAGSRGTNLQTVVFVREAPSR